VLRELEILVDEVFLGGMANAKDKNYVRSNGEDCPMGWM
jgi:hypothetical protein